MMACKVPEMAYRRAGLDRPRDMSNIEFNEYGLMGHFFSGCDYSKNDWTISVDTVCSLSYFLHTAGVTLQSRIMLDQPVAG